MQGQWQGNALDFPDMIPEGISYIADGSPNFTVE